jgi:hypothetical protein
MTVERIIMAFAGTVILASLALAHYVNPNWLWLTAFAGANMFQAAFTGLCLPAIMLKKLGVKTEAERATAKI